MAPLATAGRGVPREGPACRALARLGAPQYQVRQAGTPAGAHAAARLGGPLARLRAVAAPLLNLQGASDNRPLYIVQFTSLALALVYCIVWHLEAGPPGSWFVHSPCLYCVYITLSRRRRHQSIHTYYILRSVLTSSRPAGDRDSYTATAHPSSTALRLRVSRHGDCDCDSSPPRSRDRTSLPPCRHP